MAVNQAQVDHIISSASADDPEVKLLKLQDEVDLIKHPRDGSAESPLA